MRFRNVCHLLSDLGLFRSGAKTPVLVTVSHKHAIYISQGSVVTHLMYGDAKSHKISQHLKIMLRDTLAPLMLNEAKCLRPRPSVRPSLNHPGQGQNSGLEAGTKTKILALKPVWLLWHEALTSLLCATFLPPVLCYKNSLDKLYLSLLF